MLKATAFVIMLFNANGGIEYTSQRHERRPSFKDEAICDEAVEIVKKKVPMWITPACVPTYFEVE